MQYVGEYQEERAQAMGLQGKGIIPQGTSRASRQEKAY
jgi:hypothetical protein